MFIKDIILTMAHYIETYKRYKVSNKKRFILTLIAILLFFSGALASVINTIILFNNYLFIPSINNHNNKLGRDYYFKKFIELRSRVLEDESSLLDAITELEHYKSKNSNSHNIVEKVKNEIRSFSKNYINYIESLNHWSCFRVKVNALNVRNGATSDSKILFTLTKNDIIKAVSIDNNSNWYEITYITKNGDKIYGWVNPKYLSDTKCNTIKE